MLFFTLFKTGPSITNRIFKTIRMLHKVCVFTHLKKYTKSAKIMLLKGEGIRKRPGKEKICGNDS